MNEYIQRLQDELMQAERAAYWSYKALQRLEAELSCETFKAALAYDALQKCHELFAEREARLFGEEVQP